MSIRTSYGRAFVALIATLGLAQSIPASAADFTMKIGLATFKDVQHQWADWMKEGIEARSNGRIEVQIFPRGQLGPVARQIEGVQLGTQEGFVAPTDFFAGVDPRFGAFAIPVVFESRTHAAAVIQDPALNPDILGLATDKGLEVVSVFTHSVAHYLARDPIRAIEDFKGKKMRINATAAEREKMRRLGATGVPMDLSEVVPGLERGVIDGTMSGTVVYVIFSFINVAKVLTETKDTMIVSAGVVSKPWLAKLPGDLREIVIDEGRKLQARTSTFSHEQEDAMIQKWKDAGGELVTLPDAELARMRALLADVGDVVTKDDPQLNGFYRKLVATAKRH